MIRELDQIFGSAMEPRSKYQLRVVNKGILLDEGKVVQEYPITSGDLIEIEDVYKRQVQEVATKSRSDYQTIESAGGG